MRKTLGPIFLALLGFAPLGLGGPSGPRTIDIRARRFEFVPGEIRVKKGQAVLLRVRSEDVKHGFFSRPLHLDADLEPGRSVEIPLTADEAGTYLVICDHFCGARHAEMKLTVLVDN